MEQTVYLYTDGACKGNPGTGGWGALLRYGRHEKELSGGARDTTNNRMELTAVIEGLKALKRKSRVEICTDSQYVKNGMESWIRGWKKNGWKTSAKQPVKNEDLWRELDRLVAEHDVVWTWVKGHAGHPENERADALANQGAAAAKQSGERPQEAV
ncbi:ribonuclease HI [Neisseria sp. 23W00296]|uniref:ribonuclease HI n=1 Tax=unclassified Neisseria TaxID=2623750 RepID=UPI0002A2CFEE|nr:MULTISPECIES: ribonuclease HI [unclassified Neisseria]ASP17539.1 ribonuclease HI [Neisseria sp. KEM232]EKY09815.1 ribonuclease HI [Neisseria sp. oral taxon 020 str. F0370]